MLTTKNIFRILNGSFWFRLSHQPDNISEQEFNMTKIAMDMVYNLRY